MLRIIRDAISFVTGQPFDKVDPHRTFTAQGVNSEQMDEIRQEISRRLPLLPCLTIPEIKGEWTPEDLAGEIEEMLEVPDTSSDLVAESISS